MDGRIYRGKVGKNAIMIIFTKKWILFFTAILTVAIMSISCSSNAQVQSKAQKQVKVKLKNFSISLVTESESQDPFYFKQVYSNISRYLKLNR
jgi:hypothetical protein